MINREQAVRLYSELSRRTQEGAIQWVRVGQAEVSGWRGDALNDSFIAKYNNWRLGLLRIGIRRYDGERDVHYWEEDVRLVLLNSMDRVEFEFPEAPGLSDLLGSVTYMTSNAADFVADILGGNKPKAK